jgi:cysteine-rich repeat protein
LVEGDPGFEACDDGDQDNEDECTNSCALARCGDGFTRAGLEDCDDANQDDADGCRNACILARCGDGVQRQDLAIGAEGFESCDDGNQEQTDACLITCIAASCGDGHQQNGVEDCDDGNRVDDDDCNNNCQLRNGVQAFGEWRPALACGDFSRRGASYQQFCFQLRGNWLCTGQHSTGAVQCEDIAGGIRFTYDWNATWPFRFTPDNQTCQNYHADYLQNFSHAIGYRNFRVTMEKSGNSCTRTYIDNDGNFASTNGDSGSVLPYVIEYTN